MPCPVCTAEPLVVVPPVVVPLPPLLPPITGLVDEFGSVEGSSGVAFLVKVAS